ncbi:MAG: glycosyltransferase family 39 protein [Chloroflexi bacterium]|nr:glycosyltransferase family 39 protein [Chloroflexota bacterium]
MSVVVAPPRTAEAPARVEPLVRRGGWYRVALAGILALAAGLNVWGLTRVGYGNEYYAAAVLSMLQNWHNLFFASFDPGGFVTIDKPPLGFWVQAASARLLGFSGFSILLPEALAGVGSVAVVYQLVGRAFGRGAGLLAALFLALTPVAVSVSRNNTIDSLLVFTLLLAAWTAVKAAETGRLRWLVLTAVVVGLGFEIKMLEAYLVVPALGLLYLVAAPRRLPVRIGHLALAGVVLLAVSFAWPVAVDLTPANQRPWVDSTQTNSEVDLALGYNGIQRLLGRGASVSLPGSAAAADDGGAFGGAGGGPGGVQETGTPGPLRLLNQQLGGQASWLLALSIAGLVATGAAAWRTRRQLSLSRRGQAFIVWGTWLATAGSFFSIAEYFHSYYLVTLGPPIAALAAIGIVEGWRAFRAGTRLAWLLPVAIAAGGLLEAQILVPYVSTYRLLLGIVLVGTSVSAAVLAGTLLFHSLHGLSQRVFTRVAAGAAALGVVTLLIAPGVWASMPALGGGGGGFLPSAGPAVRGGPGGGFPGGSGEFPGSPVGFPGGPGASTNDQLIQYLEAHQGSDEYLLATSNSNAAAPIILATGQPVMSLGGFLGSDPILTAQQFAQMVQDGVVRFAMTGGGPGFGGRAGTGGVSAWVQQNCTPVSLGAPTSTAGGGRGGFGGGQLYDCAPQAG